MIRKKALWPPWVLLNFSWGVDSLENIIGGASFYLRETARRSWNAMSALLKPLNIYSTPTWIVMDWGVLSQLSGWSRRLRLGRCEHQILLHLDSKMFKSFDDSN